jgi:predicted nucleic acid-binding protein
LSTPAFWIKHLRESDLELIKNNSLMGRGLGYVDIHLLASAILGNVVLWTLERRLYEAATELGIAYTKN